MFDEQEEEPIISPDTENATHFHALEAPPELREKFTRFHGYNTGVYNGHWADNEEIRRLDNLNLFDAISSYLEMTRWQKKSGRSLFDSFNLNHFGYRAELVAFSICIYVCRLDGRMYHPKRADENNDTLFVQYATQLPESTSTIEACYTRVSEVLK